MRLTPSEFAVARLCHRLHGTLGGQRERGGYTYVDMNTNRDRLINSTRWKRFAWFARLCGPAVESVRFGCGGRPRLMLNGPIRLRSPITTVALCGVRCRRSRWTAGISSVCAQGCANTGRQLVPSVPNFARSTMLGGQFDAPRAESQIGRSSQLGALVPMFGRVCQGPGFRAGRPRPLGAGQPVIRPRMA